MGRTNWRREWDSNPRYGTRIRALQARSFDHSDISPMQPVVSPSGGGILSNAAREGNENVRRSEIRPEDSAEVHMGKRLKPFREARLESGSKLGSTATTLTESQVQLENAC